MSFEEYLAQLLEQQHPSRTRSAMEYALLSGGKRVRPQLLFSALKDYGLPEETGYPAGAALEMIHTYSLIHDDLPAMDNDDFRRGQPSTHKAFDEATAILAGDALQPLAFLSLLQTENKALHSALVQILAESAGISGMVYGQDLDLAFEKARNATLQDLLEIDYYKTARLLIAPLQMAAVLAGHEEDLPAMEALGKAMGLQFQIQDDILDVTSSPEQMGKSLSDTEREKTTAVSILGLEKAEQMVQDLKKEQLEVMASLHLQPRALKELVEALGSRTH